ncbi:MAG: AsmA family protein [Muribaculaceae bacterium]|nr:AsmA family protein [Muribaculaceae bacterium]
MKKLLQILAGTVVTILIIAFIAVNITVWLTRPSRLTAIIEHVINENINGEITVGNAELTLWSTFPRAGIAISDIKIVSHALHDAPDYIREDLMEADDSLLSIKSVRADINIWRAIHKDIRIDSIIVDDPICNLVIADADWANFDIIKLKHDSGAPSVFEQIKHLKGLSINTIQIKNAGESHYTSLLDNSEMAFRIPDFTLDGTKAPDYRISLDTEIMSEEFAEINLYPMEIGLHGDIIWDFHRPERLELDSIDFNVGDICFLLSARMDLQTDFSINALDFTIDHLSINALRSHLPQALAENYADLETDLEFTFNLAVADTIFLNNLSRVPSARMTLDIPECQITYSETSLSAASLYAHADLIGAELDRSTVTVDRLTLVGDGFDAQISGTVTSLLDDPTFDANIKGDIDLDRLPPALLRAIPVKIKGSVVTDAGVNMRMSDLSENELHNIYLSGGLTLSDFGMKVKGRPVKASGRKAVIDFGKASSYSPAGYFDTDSRLSLTMSVDTATVAFPGNLLGISDLLVDLGTPGKTDAAMLGHKLASLIRVATLTVDAPDSVRIRFRDSEATAVLSPYPADPKLPQIGLNFTARRFTTRAPGFGIAFSQPTAKAVTHLLAHPHVPARLPKRGHINELDTIIRDDAMDWNVAAFLEKYVLYWAVDGNVRTNAGFVFVHDFPLRQRASAIDLDFNTDSVTINSLRYTAGNSVFDIKGVASNLARAFTSFDRTAPLALNLDITSPRVDLNELLVTSLHETGQYAGPDPDYTENIPAEHHLKTDTTAARPLIIPRNIAATLNIGADTVLYSDLSLHSLDGTILIANSALNLHELRASSPVGSTNLSALYWAPDTTNMRFGVGLELNQFDLGRTLRLIPPLARLMPALKGFSGNIDAQLAATTDLRPDMTIDMDSFKGAVQLEGDSLALVDPKKFSSLSRWLLFHDHKHIDIDHMDVEMVISDKRVDLFPFIFDIDRYRLGVMGTNNLEMDLNYHISVLKSPIPFKFGINVTGSARDPKIRLGGAKIKPEMVRRFNLADSTRRSLVSEINTVFSLGTMSNQALNLPTAPLVSIDEYTDSLSDEETLWMRREGWIRDDELPEHLRSHKHDSDSTSEGRHKRHFWFF